MPKLSNVLTLLLPALLLLSAQPSQAQNRGGRTSVTVTGSAPRASAPRSSAPRSVPRASTPSRSSGSSNRSYSAPTRATVTGSAPRANSSSYRAPSNTTRQNYSAPTRSTVTGSAPRSNNSSYRAPSNTSRQNYSAPTRSTVTGNAPRAGNSRYSAPNRSANPGTSVTVTGSAPTYPGRMNASTARTYSPSSSSRGLTNSQVRGLPTASNGRFNNVTTNPNGGTSTTVTGRVPNNGYNPGNGLPFYNQPQVVGNVYNNNNYYVRDNCAPRYNDCYDNSFYSNYNYRRGYRYYQPCYNPFLSLGFFVSRPYAYYDYAQIDYAQPFVYGDDQYYRSAPVLENEQVASTQPVTPPSLEQEMLNELASYVDSHSKEQRFQIADPAFGGQMWNLDLTQAPAVYSIDSNHYSVVSGFEGTLGDNSIPSSVGLEFFVARENGRWNVKEAWIVSANGIPRAKKFQSPSFPQVQTWQAGEVCPFSGLPMVPVTQTGAQQG